MSLSPSHFLFASLLLSATAAAQIGQLTLSASTGSDPRSVCVIGNNHVVVSNRIDGWQHFIDVTNPAAPTLTTTFNPPYGDQWFEAEFTSQWGGRLFTGHRGGGLNMIDVSNPSSPVTAASYGSTYHFRGLRFNANSAGGALYYNETNAGLQCFGVTSNTLTPVWNAFATNNDANGLEIFRDEIYHFGTPYQNPTTRIVRGYSLFPNPTSPTQNYFATIPNQASSGHCQLRGQGVVPYILASRWTDGLQLLNVSIPTAPVTTPILPANPNLLCWGTMWFPNSTFAVAYGSLLIGNTRFYWWLILNIQPNNVVIPVNVFVVPFDTRDMRADPNTGRIYVTGIDTNSQLGKLLIY